MRELEKGDRTQPKEREGKERNEKEAIKLMKNFEEMTSGFSGRLWNRNVVNSGSRIGIFMVKIQCVVLLILFRDYLAEGRENAKMGNRKKTIK